MATKVVLKVKDVATKDNFRAGFLAALGKVVVAAGRLEYQLKLSVKSLHNQGFTLGMAEAESDSRFWKLCEKATKLSAVKLPPRAHAAFVKRVVKARKLAETRNDHIHALWTSGPRGNALRYRPRLNNATKTVLWDRNQRVRVSELNALATKARKLLRAMNNARLKWKVKP